MIDKLIRFTFITSNRYNTYHRLRIRRLLQRIVSQHEIYRESADEHSFTALKKKLIPYTSSWIKLLSLIILCNIKFYEFILLPE